MPYTQTDIDTLKAAIATGAKRVRFGAGPDAREVEYRSLAEMKEVLAAMEAEVAGAEVNTTVGAYHSGLC